MSELNEKLIDYGGLEHFRDLLLNNSGTTSTSTWSSSKINEEIQAVGGTADSEFDGKTTEDFRFVTELPKEATEGEQVVIKGENKDTLYKYVSGAWAEQTPDATVLYFDTENEALYSYVSAEQQFATISSVNTIVVGKNLNASEALKAIKTPGTYSVLQRTSSTTKGEYTRKWTLTVEGIDYDEYELTDSVYQRIQSNFTIQKRTWSSTRTTNDGWTNFSTYYAGEIKDTTTSKYYTWSSNKINDTRGYVFDETKGSFVTKYRQDAEDGGALVLNIASGLGAVAEGYGTTASGDYGSHAEGNVSVASGIASHAEGNRTQATAMCSHAEGTHTIASGKNSHAEGGENNATGSQAHAEGCYTTAQGYHCHAEGFSTIAQNFAEHSEGQYNLSHKASDTYDNAGNTQHSIGIGSNKDSRKNAFEIMQNGDVYITGVGGYKGTDTKVQDATIKTLQEYIASLEARIAALEGNTAAK
jgi:hypothetical protein